MNIIWTILAEFLLVSTFILLFYRLEPWFGLIPLYVLIGTNQYFQNILFKSGMISFFGEYTISPGATILFSASLFTILLIYLKKGVRTTRNLIFGIVMTNMAFTLFSGFVDLQIGITDKNIKPLSLDNNIFALETRSFIVGTILLIVDAFLIVILYEFFQVRVKWLKLFPRLIITLLLILNLDAFLFVTGSFWGNPGINDIMTGQVIGKSIAALFFATVLFLYLRYLDKSKNSSSIINEDGKEDILSILNYRGKFEKLKTEKAISEEQLQKIISVKTSELESALRRYTIMATVRELRIDKFSSVEKAKELLIKVREAFNIDACTIHLIDKEELKMLSSVGITEEGKVFKMMYTFPYLQKIVEEKQSLCIEDTSTDSKIYSEFLTNSNIFAYKSCAGAPLLSDGKVIGLLKLYSVHTKRSFTTLEMEHLQVVARQVAHSIEASQLFEQNEKHKKVLVKQIIARKKVEEAIKESEEKYRTLAEAIPDYIMRYDKEGRHTYMNQAALAISGKTASEVIGKKHLEAGYDKEQSVFWEGKINHVFKTGEFYTEQFSWDSAKGKVYLDWRLSPELDDKGNVISVLGVSRDITKLMEAEAAIRQSEEKYRNLIENASDPIMIYQFDGTILDCNKSTCDITGYTKEELLKIKIIDLAFQEDLVEKPFQFETLKEGKTTIVERRLKNKNGSSIDLEVNNRMMPDGTIMLVGRDLSERKKAEEKIRISNERFELIGKAANDALWEWNMETGGLWGNLEHQQLYGLTLADTVPDDEAWKNNLHEEDRPHIINSVNKALTSRVNVWDGEYRLYTVNKGWITVYGRTYIERNENGKPIRMLGSMMDITKQKENELQVLRERNLSDSIINSLPGVFYLFDESPKFLRWNKNFEIISGYSAEEFSNMVPLSLFIDKDKPEMKKQIDKVRNEGYGSSEAILITKNGEKIPFYFTGVSISYEGKNCVLGNGVDITERKKSEKEILEINKQLRNLSGHLQNVREEERKRIGREIHDDLGQQLTAIKMDVAWIDKKTPEDVVPIKSKLKNIISLLDGSNQSVRRILNELKPSILDEYGLIDALKWHSKLFTDNTGIPVQFNTSESEVGLPENIATCIFRVFQESLTNITRHAAAKNVITSIELVNQQITVTIEDDGIGFDTNLVKEKGTFGLLGMYERVRSLAGELVINSVIGSGTSITISFTHKR